MPLPLQNKEYTIDDIYALPDGQRAELIDGQMYMMAPPTRRHQQILLSLGRKIADYIDRKGGLIARLFFGVLALIPYLCFRKRRYGAAPPNIVSGTKKQCPRLRKALFVEPIKNLYDP